jgi:hypothetical protein
MNKGILWEIFRISVGLSGIVSAGFFAVQLYQGHLTW